eukprot:TRINITY_DN650_c0_g2_i6.p1 TRINITY_DN650_c0_g2~~TRINITY_DN650_c0_g2_i6.p1  ORF type:complete len:261 (+),score=55.56 TRINITY_DN650_c0_g2_i6:75-857(+)
MCIRDRGYKAPTFILIKHIEMRDKGVKDNDGVNIFGGFTSTEWQDQLGYAGDFNSAIFSLYPRFQYYSSLSDGENCFTYLNTKRIDNSKFKSGLGFGGNKYFEKYRIWIDDDLEHNSYIGPDDSAYESGFLAEPHVTKLKIETLEIWGAGDESTFEQQIKFREDEMSELERMRKVDRKAFVNSQFDKEIMFDKTFAHGYQVRVDTEMDKDERILKAAEEADANDPKTFSFGGYENTYKSIYDTQNKQQSSYSPRFSLFVL